MNIDEQHHGCLQFHDCRHQGFHRGPSSFYKHDSVRAFETLDLHVGDTFLDLGCGAGDYCFHAAKSVGEAGTVYAVDLYQSIVDDVSRNAREQGIPNIYPVVSDISKHIDVADDMIDTCLVATVLHTIRISAKKTNLFSEIHRVLKPGGKLAIIECKGNEGPSGPPPTSRILPEELEKDCARYGFVRTGYVDLGPTYMMVFAVDD